MKRIITKTFLFVLILTTSTFLSWKIYDNDKNAKINIIRTENELQTVITERDSFKLEVIRGKKTIEGHEKRLVELKEENEGLKKTIKGIIKKFKGIIKKKNEEINSTDSVDVVKFEHGDILSN